MRVFTTILTLLFFGFLLKSQTKSDIFKLNKSEEIVEIIDVGNKGFLLETLDKKKVEFKLIHYSNDITKQWETPLDLLYEQFTTSSSKYSDYVYITTTNLQLDLLNKNSKRIEMEDVPKGRFLKSDFQDYRYWYSLYYVKFNSTYFLRRLEHKTTFIKDLSINLPKAVDYKYSTEWYYLTNDNNNIYLYNKTGGYLNQNRKLNNKIEYQIVTIDSNAQSKSNLNIKLTLDSSYIYPSQNFKKGHEFPSPVVDFDFQTVGGKDLYIPKPEAYSSIIFDSKNKMFYIYGLCGSLPFVEKDRNSLINSFFIYKYDNNGNLIKKIVDKLPNDTTIYGGYETKTLLTITPDNKLIFQINFDKIINPVKLIGIIFSFSYFEDKLISKYVSRVPSERSGHLEPMTYDYIAKSISNFDFVPISKDYTGAIKYYNSLSMKQRKDNILRLFRYTTGDVVIEEDTDKNLINIILFGK